MIKYDANILKIAKILLRKILSQPQFELGISLLFRDKPIRPSRHVMNIYRNN